MKNLLIAFTVVALSSTGAYAYFTTIQNASDGEIKATITYGGPGICSQEDKLVAAGQTATIDTKICCTSQILFTATSGRGVGAGGSVRFNPPATGFGLACRDFKVIVRNAANGMLVAEQG